MKTKEEINRIMAYALLDPRQEHIDWFDDTGRIMVFINRLDAEKQQEKRKDRRIIEVVIIQTNPKQTLTK